MSTDNRKPENPTRTEKQDEKISDIPSASEQDAQQVKGGARKNVTIKNG